MLVTAKIVAIIFALAATGLCVSTIVLAVQKAELSDELQDALDKLDMLIADTTTSSTSSSSSSTSTTTTTTTSTVTPPTQTPPTGAPPPITTTSTSSPPGTNTTSSTSTTTTTTTPSPSNVTSPQENPNYPTLPTGLPNPAEILYRLPHEMHPVRYILHFEPDLETGKCEGSVSIQLEIDSQTNLIVMHASKIEIVRLSILQMMVRMRMRIKAYYVDEQRELLIIELEELLYPGVAYVVSIDFISDISGLVGIYGSSYLGQDDQTRSIATTKFEPTYARQAFPCFDEPAMKAPYDITLVYKTTEGYHALSNMNIETETVVGDKTEVHFMETPPMSTYLVCFILSDMVSKTATVQATLEGAHDFPMRVFATPGQLNKVDYALETGVKVTEYYIGYFEIPYPLYKLDMAAIPDYVSGATEHWGLITYRETSLLYDPLISSSENKQRVATVVAHELAHMWFGNLVTMKWWNDIWLNEGFASYIEYKGVNHAEPQWDMMNQFVIADLHPVLRFDATLTSHPIVQTANSPSEISELFDTISYSKGAAVIRMLENVVGEAKFRNATTKYLNSYLFTNAETDDFLRKIEEEGFDFDVKLFMQTWTDQMGYPVVQVAKQGNTYTLTQKRFLANPEDYNATVEPSTFNYRWTIPLCYVTSENSELQTALFNYNDESFTVTVPSAVSWIKLNKDELGYYRVNYDAETWQQLTTALKNSRGAFSTADRANLLDDAFALADAAQLSFSTALDLFSYVENELDYIPWHVAVTHLASLERHLYYTDSYTDFTTFARKLLQKAYTSVTWNVGNDHVFNLLRVKILDASCHYGLEEALQQARNLFEAWLENDAQRPNPDIRSTVYYYGMQASGSEKHWNHVWQLFISEQDAQEKLKLMRSLAAIKEPWILQRFINRAWNESYVRPQDYFTCLQNIAANPIGESLVWDYVRENWPALVQRFGIQSRQLGQLIPAITKRFASQTKAEEMQAFFNKYPEGGAGTTSRKSALQTVLYNIKWIEGNKAEVANWLVAYNAPESVTESPVDPEGRRQ